MREFKYKPTKCKYCGIMLVKQLIYKDGNSCEFCKERMIRERIQKLKNMKYDSIHMR